jgi:uncharacterized membrane protein YtjA (UPF0391 family)
MKIIPTFAHGIFDYVGGLALLAAPNIFGFSDVGGAAVWVPRVLGVIILLQAITTRYELGLVKMLPMKMHIMNDYVASLFLAASPWLFGFANGPSNQWMPHLVVGIIVFVATLMTQSEPRSLTAAR